MAEAHNVIGTYRLTSTSAPQARRGLDECLRGLGWVDTDRYDVAVALSEVATNAVRHAGGRFSVYARVYADRVRVQVRDDSAAAPRLRPPGEDGGIGLRVVDRLASSWAWDPDGQGKVVEFTVPRRTPVTA